MLTLDLSGAVCSIFQALIDAHIPSNQHYTYPATALNLPKVVLGIAVIFFDIIYICQYWAYKKHRRRLEEEDEEERRFLRGRDTVGTVYYSCRGSL